jgi:hypothetical protein
VSRSKLLSRGAALLLSIAASYFLCQSATASPQKKPRRTPLTSIEVVTSIDAPKDPDDPGTGGGIDAANYFSRRLASKIATCTGQIRSTAQTWANQDQLTIVKLNQRPGDLLMHMTKADLSGFFELTYRVNLQQERARVTLFFYSSDGSRHEPSAIRSLLNTYQVGTLEDKLTQAILCGES